MNTIQIPVSRLSYKIILHDFGHEPIALHARHPLWASIVHAPTLKGRSDKYDRSIPFILPPDLYLDIPAASRYLHTTHVERMMIYTKSLFDNCMPARTAIQRFYDAYDLDDTDYDFSQTAYKSWQRWKDRWDDEHKKAPAKRAQFVDMYVLRKAHLAHPAYKPLTDAELSLRTDLVSLRLFELQPDAPDYLFRQVAIFIWKMEGGRSSEELSIRFGLHRANIDRSIKRIMHQAKHDTDFRSIFEEKEENLISSL